MLSVLTKLEQRMTEKERAELAAYGLPGTPPAAPALTTPATDWEGEGEIVSYEQIIAVRNPTTGQVSQRREIDFTKGPWVQLSKGA